MIGGYEGDLAMKIGNMDPRKFLRFVAKTAHAYAIAEHGLHAFEPMLLDIIFGRSQAICHLVGGDPRVPELTEGASTAELYLGSLTLPEGEFVSVKFQLYPLYGSPIHIIIVGKAKGP